MDNKWLPENTGEEDRAILGEAEKLLLSRGVVLPISHSPAVNIVDMGGTGGLVPRRPGHTSLQVSFLQTKPPTPCLTAMSGIPKFAGRVKKKTMRLDVRI